VFMRADVRELPFHQDCFDAALDRSCFHYLPPRPATVRRTPPRPAARARPRLRASLRTAGVRNDIKSVTGHTFAAWQIEHMQPAAVPSGTRTLEAFLARLSTTSPS
jgi:hypothetical protein